MSIKAGDLFLALLPDGSAVPHLCIALSDEAGIPVTAFVVPVMTPITGKTDTTVMLPVSACPDFLQYESSVAYNHMVEIELDKLESVIRKRYYPLSADHLERVIDGVFQSRLTPRGHRQRFKEWRASK